MGCLRKNELTTKDSQEVRMEVLFCRIWESQGWLLRTNKSNLGPFPTSLHPPRLPKVHQRLEGADPEIKARLVREPCRCLAE